MADGAAPTHQSKCEVASNAFKAAHPKIDPWDMMKAGYFWFGGTIPPEPPMEYRDEVTGITVSSGSDGRTLTAKNRDGISIWVRDPFVEGNMCPYRTGHPYISRLESAVGDFGHFEGKKFIPLGDTEANEFVLKNLRTGMSPGYKLGELRDTDRFVSLWFNSSQNGVVNLRNGDFYFMGQN